MMTVGFLILFNLIWFERTSEFRICPPIVIEIADILNAVMPAQYGDVGNPMCWPQATHIR